MPYPNVPDDMQDKMEDCVQKVMGQGHEKDSAIAICHASIVDGKSLDEALKSFELDGVKSGARNSSEDRQRIRSIRQAAQAIHATTMEMEPNDADPEPGEPERWQMMLSDDKSLVALGGAVKSLGDGRVGGYLVRYGSPAEPDASPARDFFTPETDFMAAFPCKSAAWFNHALDGQKQRLSHDADLHRDEFGVWAETILDERDKYEKFLLDLAGAGKLGWSSGTAAHLVQREPAAGGTHQVKRWPIGLDASLTHIPAEPRNTVMPLKSIIELLPQLPPAPEPPEGDTAPVEAHDASGNSSNNLKSIQEVTMDLTQEQLQDMLKAAATEAIKALPAIDPAVGVQVTKDEADKPFKSLADECMAVKNFTLSHGTQLHPRLRPLMVELKAIQGANEAVPSQGGFLLDPEISQEFIGSLFSGSGAPFTSRVNRIPTTKAYGWENGIDETSRATGSRWGGLRGYRLGEGDTITSSKPKFRRINWDLNKYACLVYDTGELLDDAPRFAQVVRQGCSEEIAFMLNDDILNYSGGAGLAGILPSEAKVSVPKETGQAAATLLYENVIKMWQRLAPRCKSNAIWFVNSDVMPEIHKMALAVGTGGIPANFVTYSPDGSTRIFGHEVVETEFNATLGTQGDIMVADLSWYTMWEKVGGIQAASSMHVEFLTDQEVFRFIFRADGEPILASPLTPYKGSNTLSPFVVLDTRS